MTDRRPQLPIGTCITLLPSNSCYRITGKAIGFGGGSILYPAERMVGNGDDMTSDGLSYVIKECFPVSADYAFTRNEDGAVVPKKPSERITNYLTGAKQMQLREKEISQVIYKTSARMLPIRDSAESILLALPGKESKEITNTITVMDSLAEKGQSIRAMIEYQRNLPVAAAFRIIQQQLFSLREVHQAGYLHLDIQDGNIFLHGSLDQQSEFTTLIDFGSARKMTGGKTEPIADRIIFTSEGFTAPEMLLHNDGTLQLGPEADIFSTACLVYYLLTGQRAVLSRIITEKTGKILKPFQLSRMKCPKHLIGSIQKILAKALQEKPEDRYHSADEMLKDVTELIHALQPYRTDLAAVKYDAFICYKHGVIDSPVAKNLQKNLENFRAPKSVSLSRKPFHKVFLDEGELSSCADFGQQIREALKNAGWLIVVCSPDTPSSPWVRLEIETFLEYHDRSRILAVLIDGEPQQSFPQQLLGESVEAGEVLAADARGVDLAEIQKKMHGDALLKLTAPMLGVTFDSLKQRQRTYFYQRAAIAAGIAGILMTGFAGFAWNRATVISEQAERIEEEYNNALKKESRYLATASQAALEDNDRLLSISVALAALPSENNPRPYVPEAEAALVSALNPYNNSPGDIVNRAAFTCNSDVNSFCISEDESFLIAYDSSDYLYCWEIDRYRLCFTRNYGEKICATCPINDGQLLVCTEKGLRCIQIATGDLKWEYLGMRNYFSEYSFSLSPSQNRVAIIEHGIDYDSIIFLSCQNGEIENTITTEDIGKQLKHSVKRVFWSANEQSVFLEIEENSSFELDTKDYYLFQYDFTTRQFFQIVKRFSNLIGLHQMDNGNLLIVDTEYFYALYQYLNYTYYHDHTVNISCVSLSGEILWTNSFQSDIYTKESKMTEDLYQGNGDKKQAVYIQCGDVVGIYSIDGEQLACCRIQSSILQTDISDTYVRMLAEDGITYIYDFKEGKSAAPLFDFRLEHAIRTYDNKFFVSALYKNQILYFSFEESEGEINILKQAGIVKNIGDTMVKGDCFVISGRLEANLCAVQIFAGNHTPITVTVPSQYFTSIKILDYDEEKQCVYIIFENLDSEYAFYSMDILSGILQRIPSGEFEIGYSDFKGYQNGVACLSLPGTTWDSTMLGFVNLPDGSTWHSRDFREMTIRDVYPSPDAAKWIIEAKHNESDSEVMYYLYDVKSDELKTLNIPCHLSQVYLNPQNCSWMPDSTEVFIADNNIIYCCSSTGEIKTKFTASFGRILFIQVLPDAGHLICINTRGMLNVLDMNSGAMLFSTGLGHYANDVKNFHFSTMQDWSLLIGISSIWNVLDPETYTLKAFVMNCAGYRADLNAFCRYAESYDGYQAATTQYYSLTELQELAKHSLRDYSVPEDSLISLGIK